MSVRLLEPAQREMDDAVEWYMSQAPGLGDAFLAEALRAFDLIERYPLAWHPLSNQVRRCRRRRFPYGVIYTDGGDMIIVLAIAHLHRRPGYWRERLRDL